MRRTGLKNQKKLFNMNFYVPDSSFMYFTVSSWFLISFVMGGKSAVMLLNRTSAVMLLNRTGGVV